MGIDLTPPFGDGGKGPERSSADPALARRAIRDRWPIPDATRAKLVEWLAEVVGTTPDDRARVAAAKALIEADKLNLEQEKRDLGLADRLHVTAEGSVKHDHTHTLAGTIDHLAAAFAAAADRQGEGGLPGDGAEQPVAP